MPNRYGVRLAGTSVPFASSCRQTTGIGRKKTGTSICCAFCRNKTKAKEVSCVGALGSLGQDTMDEPTAIGYEWNGEDEAGRALKWHQIEEQIAVKGRRGPYGGRAL